jgi:hypothetical protein
VKLFVIGPEGRSAIGSKSLLTAKGIVVSFSRLERLGALLSVRQ